LQTIERTFIDPVYGFDYEFTGYTLGAIVPSHDRLTARNSVATALAGASADFVRQELARLRASTKARPEDGDDLAMRFQVLADECREYPPDVVRHALRGWAQREVFFPALAEIRDELQRLTRRRRALLVCLRHQHSAVAAE